MKSLLTASLSAAIFVALFSGFTLLNANGQRPGEVQTLGSENPSSQPSCVYCPDPHFPNEAQKAKITEAAVELEVTVSTNGEATNIHVVSDPGSGFSASAVEAVKKWAFKPALDKDGKAVRVTTRVLVTFRLKRNQSK